MEPENCRYSRGHTWVRVENGEATLGITDHAQKQLGDVLFVEVTEKGKRLTQFQSCGTIESNKATAEIMAPVSGEVIAVNEEVINAPELVNKEPYGVGWLLKVRLANPKELEALMSAQQFEAYIAKA